MKKVNLNSFIEAERVLPYLQSIKTNNYGFRAFQLPKTALFQMTMCAIFSCKEFRLKQDQRSTAQL